MLFRAVFFAFFFACPGRTPRSSAIAPATQDPRLLHVSTERREWCIAGRAIL